jgi:protein-S-isoprenylcysteine O-methyltransferase Ste14
MTNERAFFDMLLIGWFVLSAVVFVLVFWIKAPYGRHIRKGWGPVMPSIYGWMLMELPAVLVPLIFFSISHRTGDLVSIVFLSMWEVHYLYRTFIYPRRMNMYGKKIPVLIVSMGFVTNIGIGYLNARWLFAFSPSYALYWLYDPRFVFGLICFLMGLTIHIHSDNILRKLRSRGDTAYKIPYGGAYRWVSCPNYMGEIIQWLGWAMATWSLSGLAFAVWTFSNLAPRAYSHHQWYKDSFTEYPSERRALIPKAF